MTNVKPVDFFQDPSLTVSQDRVALLNTIAGSGRVLAFTMDGVDVQVRFGNDTMVPNGQSCWCDLEFGDGHARVIVENPSFVPVFKESIADAPVPERLPSDLIAAVIEVAIDPLRQTYGFSVTVGNAGMGEPVAPSSTLDWQFGFVVLSRDSAALTAGTLHCDESTARMLAGALAESESHGEHPEIDVGASGRVQLRSLMVPLDDFEALEALDILVLSPYGTGGGVSARIFFAPGLYFVGKLEGEVLKMEPEETQEAPEENPPAGESAPVDLNKLPVRVNFELGSVTVTLGELRKMSEGSVFEVPVPLDSPVTLRANGREIGKGALLRIEDHLGVRILELYKD